jgi:lipopolysaccharide transport system ATP-binding protein
MPSPVIQVENLSKYYRLGLIGGGTLNEDINRWIAKMRGKPDPLLKIGEKDHGNRKDGQIWALRDVSLEVNEGEILGIIGRNGAGKSTLLKILSKITAPTEGRIKIKGRVGSLLEVGTGFHPELTGRENIYLNGTILGMSHSEVTSKLEEIIEFAEMGKFIDTPVKRYSSGMTVRLAFAVAAHLEPEILVVDEVLAVGDAAFQKKCLGKMQDVSKKGRTVLFVSHNMSSIEKLCSRVMILKGGKVYADESCSDALSLYFDSIMKPPECMLSNRTDRSGNGVVKIVSFQMINTEGKILDKIRTGQDVTFRFGFSSTIDVIKNLDFCFTVRHEFGSALFRNRTNESGIMLPKNFPKEGFLDCYIPHFPLTEGTYNFGFRLLVDGLESDYIIGAYAAKFDVIEGKFYRAGEYSSFAPVLIRHAWEISSS